MKRFSHLRVCLKFVVLIFVSLVVAETVADDQTIARLFVQRNVEGTLVLSSLRGGQTFVHNTFRAQQRFAAASTFKIFNTLISLEEQVISGKDAPLKWDGHIYDIPDWNRDQTLETAFKVSCVWCFQELARRIGSETYRNYIRSAKYGLLHEPFNQTEFWLDGDLEISAIEQVDFLKKVYTRSLPFSPATYETLRQIMRVEQTPAYSLWAKTGWATRINPQVGWYVGYVETLSDVWFFAANMVIHDQKDLPLRRQLTLDALKASGVIQ
ncbi:class D beta-lactamase [Methylomonas methanica]|uniref:beta-lactamase n=1 Tax=Methylomonas methanica (strain DSM 25384 / MC09) TaxID=857087 RepID=G0A4L5_METMM|nr:class D beta-lactamase [Methylomonas methanica]AEG01606.1 Beta-lactamase [Methylomonas methanica MC09]